MKQMLIMTTFVFTVFSCMTAEGMNTTSREHKTSSVSDALTGVIGDGNILKEPNAGFVMTALMEVIGDSNILKEPNAGFVRTALMKVIGDTHSNRSKTGMPKTVYEALKSQAGF